MDALYVGSVIEKQKRMEQESLESRAYAQSWNLAVALMAPFFATREAPVSDYVQENIEIWQKYFLEKLTNR